MNKRVLLTGASGFIGAQVLDSLIGKGYEVHVVVRSKDIFFSQEVRVHIFDLIDIESHAKLMKEVAPSHLVHCAWYTEHGKYWESLENIKWFKASLSLAEQFYAFGGKRFLGLGTCAEYSWKDGICSEDETPLLPSTLYGFSKLALYKMIIEIAKNYHEQFAWARIFLPFGPRESKERLIPYLINGLLRGETVRCQNGSQLRDFLYVKEIGDAITCFLASSVQGAVNIGSGSATQLDNLALKIALMLGSPELLDLGQNLRPIDKGVQFLVADTKKLLTEVKWSPKLEMDDALLETIAWWKNKIKGII